VGCGLVFECAHLIRAQQQPRRFRNVFQHLAAPKVRVFQLLAALKVIVFQLIKLKVFQFQVRVFEQLAAQKVYSLRAPVSC